MDKKMKGAKPYKFGNEILFAAVSVFCKTELKRKDLTAEGRAYLQHKANVFESAERKMKAFKFTAPPQPTVKEIIEAHHPAWFLLHGNTTIGAIWARVVNAVTLTIHESQGVRRNALDLLALAHADLILFQVKNGNNTEVQKMVDVVFKAYTAHREQLNSNP